MSLIAENDKDLIAYSQGKKEKVYDASKTEWRLNFTRVKGKRYWRFEKGSRGSKQTKYIGNDDVVRELYSGRLSQRKSRNSII